jgi:hypothetical protein
LNFESQNLALANINNREIIMETTKSDLLESCSPSLETLQPEQNLIIKRPARDTAFTLTGQSLELACVVEARNDPMGRYAGEVYHPVTAEMQSKITQPMRGVRFHSALSQTSELFILAQKLATTSRPDCPWALSMALALDTPPGTWFRLSADRDNDRYSHEIVDLPPVENLEWADFQSVLETTLSDNIITSLDAPVLKRMSKPKVSKGNNWDGVYFDV